jgi:hypothetical protein
MNTLSLMHTVPITTGAPKKKRKHEIAFECVILKKKKSSVKAIREMSSLSGAIRDLHLQVCLP